MSDLHLPVVSIVLITCNHEDFLAQAIESVLAQQTSFPIELIIGADYSRDRTQEIALNYQAKDPARVKVLLSSENTGMSQNLARTYQAARGEYVSILEGDDYWISTEKLQRQVDLLQQNPDCVMCAHRTRITDELGIVVEKEFLSAGQKAIFRFDDILGNYLFHTSSVLFRKSVFSHDSDWFFSIGGVDWVLFQLLASHGDLILLDEVMSVYRIHSGGIWSPTNYIHRYPFTSRLYVELYHYLDSRFKGKIYNYLKKFYQNAADTYLTAEDNGNVPSSLLKSGAEHFLDLLLADATLSRSQKSRLQRSFWGGYFANLAFRALKEKNNTCARRQILSACRYDLSWLANKGFWSLLRSTMN